MLKVACPCCGQSFSPEQMSELAGELAEYAPGGAEMDDEPAGKDPMAAKSMVDAIGRELDDPVKQKARAARKE